MQSCTSAKEQALSRAAEETSTYIVAGSMPEKDLNDSSKVYNTMTVWNPKGAS